MRYLRRSLPRRAVLRGSGVAMSLPWLTAMQPALAKSDVSGPPKRFVAVSLGLGLLAENLYPVKAGRDYAASLYLKPLEDLRDQMTVISGVSHPGIKGGHRAEASILTACPMGTAGQAKNSISLDQLMAKHLGDATRFPSIVANTSSNDSPCYTESGALIPAENRPSRLFRELFVDPSETVRQTEQKQVQQGRSIMDLVGEDAKSLQKKLGSGDRQRLDAYFTSVRQLERRMAEAEKWAKLAKPKVDAKIPLDVNSPNDLIARMKTMCDVLKLALETDSSRFISLHIPGAGGVIPLEGVDQGHHNLSHHGMDETKLAQLAVVEAAMIQQWGSFLRDLKSFEESESNLLDQTTVLMTSNLGNASNHDNRNMPVLVAGGGFKHAGHLAFDRKNNYPLPNLYVSILQNVGLKVDQFATSTGTMRGLDA